MSTRRAFVRNASVVAASVVVTPTIVIGALTEAPGAAVGPAAAYALSPAMAYMLMNHLQTMQTMEMWQAFTAKMYGS